MKTVSKEILSLSEGITVYEDARKKWKEMGTNSPYFKKWFRRSKVTDLSGDPLIVYHGTEERFRRFDVKRARTDIGVHFGGDHQANSRIAVERRPPHKRI